MRAAAFVGPKMRSPAGAGSCPRRPPPAPASGPTTVRPMPRSAREIAQAVRPRCRGCPRTRPGGRCPHCPEHSRSFRPAAIAVSASTMACSRPPPIPDFINKIRTFIAGELRRIPVCFLPQKVPRVLVRTVNHRPNRNGLTLAPGDCPRAYAQLSPRCLLAAVPRHGSISVGPDPRNTNGRDHVVLEVTLAGEAAWRCPSRRPCGSNPRHGPNRRAARWPSHRIRRPGPHSRRRGRSRPTPAQAPR